MLRTAGATMHGVEFGFLAGQDAGRWGDTPNSWERERGAATKADGAIMPGLFRTDAERGAMIVDGKNGQG